MVFSSIVFLFYFLPIALLLYFIAPQKAKNLTLFIASLIFYAWGENIIVVILILSAVIDFCCGHLIGKGHRKIGLMISIFFNLGILIFFKYLKFIAENVYNLFQSVDLAIYEMAQVPNVTLPIGISFFTFQTMSYTIDVYRGKVPANKNFIDFATYVTMFPQLVAGPIVRYSHIYEELKTRIITRQNYIDGIERFIIGLFKKVLIANTFAEIADRVFDSNIADLSTTQAWIGVIAYSIQIYFDFSGYSDMAIGLGKFFGFTFPENFKYPYIARSIKEFWRRWHITLSSWFRDYVYISLGGNRHGNVRTYLNLVIVFFVTGLWHGASWNFIVWGMIHGVFIVIERIGFDKVLDRLWKPVQHFYTLTIVIFSWVFFRAPDLEQSVLYVRRMLAFDLGDISANSYLSHFNVNAFTFTFFIIALVFSMPIYERIKAYTKRYRLQMAYSTFLYAAFILSIVFITAGAYNPFIYFRF